MSSSKVGRAKVDPKVRRKKTPKPEHEFELDDEGFNAAGVQIITPLSPDYEPASGRRGRKDEVSPTLTPMLVEVLKKGLVSFQMKDGEPFTIYQVRGWARKIEATGALPDGVKHLTIGGGRGQNIDVRVVLDQ